VRPSAQFAKRYKPLLFLVPEREGRASQTLKQRQPTKAGQLRMIAKDLDCGHGACFRRRATNDWVGRVLGVVTLTPYSFWPSVRGQIDKIACRQSTVPLDDPSDGLVDGFENLLRKAAK
jgi:hypothetical protein